jgi:hypothetical protein
VRGERRLLEEKSKLLDKRELDLVERESEFNTRRRKDEEKLRNEEKRIFEMEIEAKKRVVHEKRLVDDMKQNAAREMASLELGNFKKMESIENQKSEIQAQRKEIEKEKLQMRNLSNTAMLDFQKKTDELKL